MTDATAADKAVTAGDVIETHEHIRRVLKLALGSTHFDVPATQKRVLKESR